MLHFRKNCVLGVGCVAVVAPFVDERSHVGRYFAVEVHLLVRDGVHKAQRLGVERLARTGFEAVLNKLGIFGGGVASQNLVAAVAGVVEQRMPDVLHVHSDLVCAACFEPSTHHSHMPEVFEGVIVRHGMLSHVAFGENGHLQAVL